MQPWHIFFLRDHSKLLIECYNESFDLSGECREMTIPWSHELPTNNEPLGQFESLILQLSHISSLLAYAKRGGQKKLATGHHKQTAPLPRLSEARFMCTMQKFVMAHNITPTQVWKKEQRFLFDTFFSSSLHTSACQRTLNAS